MLSHKSWPKKTRRASRIAFERLFAKVVKFF